MRTKSARVQGACSLICALTLLAMAAPSQAHGIDPFTEHGAPLLHSHVELPLGVPADEAVLNDLADRLSVLRTLTGHTLLPAGTHAEFLGWDDNVVEIGLTLQSWPAGWMLSSAQATYIGDIFAQPFAHDPTFGGVHLFARVGEEAEFDSLQPFLADGQPLVAGRDETQADPDYVPQPYPAGAVYEPARGATGQAARQPTGALSGVTVFLSAGHGWTAGATSWYLQRPVLLDMCEDYGNIDQLNFMAHFAYNAGATVVTFRPVGWQPIEIILDNDEAGVTYTGTWSEGSSAKYYDGDVTSTVVYKFTDSQPTETATARFTPNITQTDYYPVYCFAIASSNRTLQTYRVSHSGGISEVTIDHRMVGNGWIWLGDYYLEAGGNNYVEITNASPESGAIIADAIRWGCGVGDIVRPGPGTISGFPRDEECQKYWAQKELGERAVGFDDEIWDVDGIDDGSDNVRTGAKWAREMNQTPAGGVQVDRWKRVHLEFHTNATAGGGAHGQICLITTLNPTTYQTQFANILSDEVDADMLIMDSEFEHNWVDRSNATYTSEYGAISGDANGNEFDATIVELAFHDTQEDAELLRDPFVRRAMARSCLQGIIKFLNLLPGSQVPQAFLPDVPRSVYAEDLGNGDILLGWDPPLSDEARGDPATGYVIYESPNGFGFGNPTVLGNVTSHVLTNVPAEETRYYRIAATNAGGESMPSEVLAIRRPASGTASVLIVNGFDSLGRDNTPIQGLPGGDIERQIFRRTNAYDYVVEHAEALAVGGESFVTTSNEAVEQLDVTMSDYEITIWALGAQRGVDTVLTGAAQTRIENYLLDGGGLFITGANIAHGLVSLGQGAAFAQDVLNIGYSSNDSGSYNLSGTTTGILGDVGVFDFNPTNGARYDVRSPDRLTTTADSQTCMQYGSGTIAGVQFTSEIYNVVTFGVPFEAITSEPIRAQIMAEVLNFLRSANGPLPFDYDRDNDIDFQDFSVMLFCWKGPDDPHTSGSVCSRLDGDADLDVDLGDLGMMQPLFTGPND
jgi:hypothetical protein